MPEKRYPGSGFEITYDLRRCAHAGECVRGLPTVFARDRTPWVDPTGADSEAIADQCRACPSGALKFVRAGRVEDPVPVRNVARVTADGPLYVLGDVEVRDHDGTVLLTDTRVAFCRCGRSSNKPLCDASHRGAFADPGGFHDMGTVTDQEPTGPITFTALLNGSLRFEGVLEIVAANETRVRKVKGSFCRCGHSKNAPICDKTHKAVGFVAGATS